MEDLTQEELNLIERFLFEQLSKKELSEFYKKMEEEAFREKVAFIDGMVNAIETQQNERLKSLLAEEENTMAQGVSSKIRSLGIRTWKYWLSVAAAVLFLVVSGWLIYFNFFKQPDLYASFFEPYSNVLNQTQRSPEAQSLELIAFQAYEKQDYVTALPAFDELLALHSSPGILFYKANTLMALDRIPEAIPILQQLASDPDQSFYVHALWYLSLAWLQQDNIEAARKNLNSIPETQNRFFIKKSEELLKKMEGL